MCDFSHVDRHSSEHWTASIATCEGNDESTRLHERITVCAFAQFSTCRDANYHQGYTVIVDNYDHLSKVLYHVFLFFFSHQSIAKDFTHLYGQLDNLAGTNADFYDVSRRKKRRCQRVNNVHIGVDQILPLLPSRRYFHLATRRTTRRASSLPD